MSYDQRLQAVLLVAEGRSAREVARMIGKAPRTVAYWVRRFETRGLAGLMDKGRFGRPKRLDETQMGEPRGGIGTAARRVRIGRGGMDREGSGQVHRAEVGCDDGCAAVSEDDQREEGWIGGMGFGDRWFSKDTNPSVKRRKEMCAII